MQIPHWPKRKNEGCMKKVEYPLTPDTTIAVGDRVRSFDFPGDPSCYFVGVVEEFTKDKQYKIKVEYQVWNGLPVPPFQNYCGHVVPVFNGTPVRLAIACGVQRIAEGEEG